jgi:tight adherence protein C
MSRTEQTELGAELKNAGYYRPSALTEYAAVRTVLVLLPLAVTGILAYFAPGDRLWSILAGGAIAVLLGFSLPRIYVLLRTRWRRREIERALPLTIDLLTLCLSAGQNILAALRQVSRELRISHPVLAEELGIVSQQADMHTLGVALRQWADRTPVPEVRNVALILEQSERLGTDVSATLQEFAAHYRTTLRQRAEARGNRVSFWMLLPSVFCLWTASAIILIGPAYVEFLHHTRDQTPGLFQKAREDINRVNQRPQQNQVAPR